MKPLGVARDDRHEGDRVVARCLARPRHVIASRFRFAGDGDELGRRQGGEGCQDDAEAALRVIGEHVRPFLGPDRSGRREYTASAVRYTALGGAVYRPQRWP